MKYFIANLIVYVITTYQVLTQGLKDERVLTIRMSTNIGYYYETNFNPLIIAYNITSILLWFLAGYYLNKKVTYIDTSLYPTDKETFL